MEQSFLGGGQGHHPPGNTGQQRGARSSRLGALLVASSGCKSPMLLNALHVAGARSGGVHRSPLGPGEAPTGRESTAVRDKGSRASPAAAVPTAGVRL